MRMSATTADPRLVGAEACLRILFPDEETCPSLRTFYDWKARGYIPYRKINQRVFYDPQEVREALDRRFKIEAAPATND